MNHTDIIRTIIQRPTKDQLMDAALKAAESATPDQLPGIIDKLATDLATTQAALELSRRAQAAQRLTSI